MRHEGDRVVGFSSRYINCNLDGHFPELLEKPYSPHAARNIVLIIELKGSYMSELHFTLIAL